MGRRLNERWFLCLCECFDPRIQDECLAHQEAVECKLFLKRVLSQAVVFQPAVHGALADTEGGGDQPPVTLMPFE
jgi:hypothetical protein